MARRNETMKQIVDEEMALRCCLTQHLPFEDDIDPTVQLAQAARAMRAYLTDSCIQERLMAIRGLEDQGDEK